MRMLKSGLAVSGMSKKVPKTKKRETITDRSLIDTERLERGIEADMKASKLNKLMEEARQDYLAGRCKPLP